MAFFFSDTPSHHDSSGHGFTLIELILVILIISLSAALMMPSFWKSDEGALAAEAKRIGNTLRYLYDEATGKKLDYVFTIDLDNDEWGFKSDRETRSFTMKKNIVFKDVLVPSLGEVSSGQLEILFSPLGPQEPVTLHILKESSEFTIKFNHLNGRAKIIEGYSTSRE